MKKALTAIALVGAGVVAILATMYAIVWFVDHNCMYECDEYQPE